MNQQALIPLLLVLAVIVATVWIGIGATRRAQSASDFFVAGRQVGVFLNASAISGEYLSAASFMGIAGLVMKHGYDALWYPVGYAVGYLFLLLFIAGPLRRFGAYTIPDFAEGRFDSPLFRKIAVTFVLFIGLFYTMPQMKGAGLTMQTILGWPYWAGIVVVGGVITFNVALGGMKGITLVQAFQYWMKAFAISVPLFILMSVYGSYGRNLGEIADAPKDAPKFARETKVKYPGKDKAPANVVVFSPLASTLTLFPQGASVSSVSLARKPAANELTNSDFPVVVVPQENVVTPFNGEVKNSVRPDNSGTPPTFGLTIPPMPGFTIPPGSALLATPVRAMSVMAETGAGGPAPSNSAKVEFAAPAEAVFSANSYVPNAQTNEKWIAPYGTLTGKHGFPLLYTYSLIIALVCGTAGLPHILVRFYTNPDGRSAKRTTFWVMVLLGVFYVFTPMWGTLGRADIPQLLANSKHDTVVIALPAALQNGTLGAVLSGITAAGAFAAFMSTFSGLLVSMSGAFAHDIYGKILRPNASAADRLRMFKLAAVGVGLVSMGLGLLVESFDIALLVGWAFAIAAASYFPLLLLGAWWRNLTMPGAAAGMLGGGMTSLLAIVTFMLLDKRVLTFDAPPLVRALLEQPAIWGVPLSLTIMIVVSRFTTRSLPTDVDQKMLRLHAPEALGLSRDYIS